MKILLSKWPLALILFVWILFASPYLFKGKIPFPSTYLATNFGPWDQYSNYGGFVKNTAAPDVITQIYPWKKLVVDALKQGKIPLWNPYVFSGTPLLANYQSAVLSPVNLLFFAIPFIDAWSISILLQPLLAGMFTYLFIRSLKASLVASSIGAISFMFCGFITTWMMYGTLAYAILYLPLALFSIEKFYENKKWYYFVLLSATIPLSFFSGHFQTSLYFLLTTIFYSLFKAYSTKNAKLFFLNILSISLGIILTSPQLLPSIELYLNSVRSGLFLKTEVIPWSYLPTFFAPDVFGNPVTRNAWYGHYAEWNGYLGLAPLILGAYGIGWKNKYALYFAVLALVSVLLAFQTPFLDLLIALKVPVLSTSAASRIIVLFSFSFSILSALGLDQLIRALKAKKYKKIVMTLTLFLIFLLITWLTALLKILIPAENVSIALSNLKLPSMIFGLLCVAIVILIKVKNKNVTPLILFAIMAITVFDLLRFSTKWQPFDPRSLIYPPVPFEKHLPQSAGLDRAFGSFGQELSLYLKISAPEGYDPLYPARYGEFIMAAQDGHFHSSDRSVVNLSKNGIYTGKILDFLGIKYIIHKISDGHSVWAFPFWTYSPDSFRTSYEDDKYQILLNDKAFPRAFVADGFKVVTDKRKILSEMFSEKSDLSKNITIEENPGLSPNNNPGGSAFVEKYNIDSISIKSETKKESLLVLTDPYYPGWKAYVDGVQTKIMRADYAFRAIKIPAGNHQITFTYDPDSFKIGIMFAAVGLAVLFALSVLWKKFLF